MQASSIIFVSGLFPELRTYDSDLSLASATPTEARNNFRHVAVDSVDHASSFIALSEHLFDRVVLYDVETRQPVISLNGVSGEGIETIPRSGISSTPIILSAGPSQLWAFNVETGESFLECPQAPLCTNRLRCFVEWSRNELYVGGRDGTFSEGILSRIDLAKDGIRIGSYEGHVEENGFCSVYDIASDISRQIVFSGSLARDVKMWSRDHNDCIQTISLSSPCTSLHFNEDSSILCCGTRNVIEVWDIRNLSNRLQTISSIGKGFVQEIVKMDQSGFYVSGGGDESKHNGTVAIWSVESAKVIQRRDVEDCVFGVSVQDSDVLSSPSIIVESTTEEEVTNKELRDELESLRRQIRDRRERLVEMKEMIERGDHAIIERSDLREFFGNTEGKGVDDIDEVQSLDQVIIDVLLMSITSIKSQSEN